MTALHLLHNSTKLTFSITVLLEPAHMFFFRINKKSVALFALFAQYLIASAVINLVLREIYKI